MSTVWPLSRYASLAPEAAGTWFANPFSLVMGRTTWLGATDRRWIVAYPMRNAFPSIPEDDEILAKMIRLLRQEVPSTALQIHSRDLRDWAGLSQSPERGFAIEDQRAAVLVGSVVLDQRRIASLLESLPREDSLSIWESSSVVNVRCVTLCIPGKWRAVLAGLDAQPEDEDVQFVPAPTGGSALDAFAHLE